MSAFDNMARNGVPTFGTDGSRITHDKIFSSAAERAKYEQILNAVGQANDFRIAKVKVEIFDMSDEKQRRAYEKLWADLLPKVAAAKACVEASRELVKRPDGTSYWMKYVEYVEFGDGKKSEKGRTV